MSEVSGFISSDNDDITATQSWRALAAHQPHVFAMHLREVFVVDPKRGSELTVDVGDLYIDYPSTGCCARLSSC